MFLSFVNSLGLFGSWLRQWFTVEFFRTIPLIALLVIALWGDGQTAHIMKYVATFLLAIALLTHFLRKVLFPYVSLKEFTDRARETPLGAALVFIGFCFVICTLIFTAADFFK